jgi:hypothetical protein
VKGRSTFDNLATQEPLNLAKPFTKKILDGKMFDTEEQALHWLEAYNTD